MHCPGCLDCTLFLGEAANILQSLVLFVHDYLTAYVACVGTVEIRLIHAGTNLVLLI